MVIRVVRKNNGNYDIVTKGGAKIHTDKDITFCIGYLSNQLKTGFLEVRVITD